MKSGKRSAINETSELKSIIFLRHLIYLILGKQLWRLKTLLFVKNIQPWQQSLSSLSGFAP